MGIEFDMDIGMRIATELEDEDGNANLSLDIFDIGLIEDGDPVVGSIVFKPKDAHMFGMNIMSIALKLEIYSAIVMVMRSHKLTEKDIDDIIVDTDSLLIARRQSE